MQCVSRSQSFFIKMDLLGINAMKPLTGVKMRETTIDKQKAIEVIKANRLTHIVDYKEAVEGYIQEVKRRTSEVIDDLQNQLNAVVAGEIKLIGPQHMNLTLPVSHESDYDTVLEMMDMEVKDQITLTTDEFTCYIKDDWDWKKDFTRVTSVYKSAISSSR